MKSWSWVILILLTIAIKWFSLYPSLVELYYTYGLYPVIVRIQRTLFGWIPFSIGDLFYAFLGLLLIFRFIKLIRVIYKKQLSRLYLKKTLQQSIFFVLFVYVFFNLLWGLNYNRTGIASQLRLKVVRYSTQDLDTLTTALQVQLNKYAALATTEQRNELHKKKMLFSESSKAYSAVSATIPFLTYPHRAVKPSLFSYLGNYLGFQGYYNPFSGEAQVNTTIPHFIEPFVTTHEIAHQLGYAKENEANFVGYLACKTYTSDEFRYSVYFDMYNYAMSELMKRDSAEARAMVSHLHPQVTKDIAEYRAFYKKYRNPVEPIITWGYGHFLKANNQPAGKQTYNEVVAWLIAYYKKYGLAAI